MVLNGVRLLEITFTPTMRGMWVLAKSSRLTVRGVWVRIAFKPYCSKDLLGHWVGVGGGVAERPAALGFKARPSNSVLHIEEIHDFL